MAEASLGCPKLAGMAPAGIMEGVAAMLFLQVAGEVGMGAVLGLWAPWNAGEVGECLRTNRTLTTPLVLAVVPMLQSTYLIAPEAVVGSEAEDGEEIPGVGRLVCWRWQRFREPPPGPAVSFYSVPAAFSRSIPPQRLVFHPRPQLQAALARARHGSLLAHHRRHSSGAQMEPCVTAFSHRGMCDPPLRDEKVLGPGADPEAQPERGRDSN
jgi:hypothetical protein